MDTMNGRAIRNTLLAVASACLLALAAGNPQAGEAPKGEQREAEEPAAEQIRMLIPKASSMTSAEFERLAKSTIVRFDPNYPNASLTYVLLHMRYGEPGLEKHLRFTPKVFAPGILILEIERGRDLPLLRHLNLTYATLINVDRITGLTCDVKGDAARGTVSFRAPDLYEGNADYVARRKEGKWEIQEFLLPGLGFRIVRHETPKGSWKVEELKPRETPPK